MDGQPELPGRLVSRPGLTALALLGSLLALFVFLPYLQFVLFGVILAYLLFPVQQQAERYVRSNIAAMAVVVAALIIILIPLLYLLTIAIQQSFRVASLVRNGEIDVASVERLFQTAGYPVDLVGLYESNQERIASTIRMVTSQAIDLVGSVPGLLIGLSITRFVLFARLCDCEQPLS
jgi:predicted PurR-regulated permease PerM